MAFRRGGFRRGGFRSRRQRLFRWTANDFDLTKNVAGADDVFGLADAVLDLANPLDYQQTSTLEPEGPTLVRIRGQYLLDVSANSAPAAVMNLSVFLGIIVTNSATSPTPSNVTSQINDDWIWIQRQDLFVNFGTLAANQPFRQEVNTYEIDIKSKRKLKDSSVRIVADFATAGIGIGDDVDVRVIGWARVLLAGRF